MLPPNFLWRQHHLAFFQTTWRDPPDTYQRGTTFKEVLINASPVSPWFAKIVNTLFRWLNIALFVGIKIGCRRPLRRPDGLTRFKNDDENDSHEIFKEWIAIRFRFAGWTAIGRIHWILRYHQQNVRHPPFPLRSVELGVLQHNLWHNNLHHVTISSLFKFHCYLRRRATLSSCSRYHDGISTTTIAKLISLLHAFPQIPKKGFIPTVPHRNFAIPVRSILPAIPPQSHLVAEPLHHASWCLAHCFDSCGDGVSWWSQGDLGTASAGFCFRGGVSGGPDLRRGKGGVKCK